MSAERVRRAERVVELRRRVVDEAQAAAAGAARRVIEAAAAARAAEDLWSREGAAPSAARLSSAELAEASAWLRALQVRAARAAAQVTAARAAAQVSHEALTGARAELRRIELWRDGLVAADRAAQDRKDRVAADEVAARVARRSP